MKKEAAGADRFQAEFDRAQAVKQRYEAELLGKANVVGIGVGLCIREDAPTDQVGIVVFVRRKIPVEQLSAEERIPHELESVPVDVQEIGDLRPMR